MLLYLTGETWTRGAASAAYAHEVCEAMRAGVHLLPAHELPSMLGDNETRCACDFNDFWNEGWTPRYLLKGDANVYKQIAVALKGGAWRPAGLSIVASKLAKGGGSRDHWRAEPQEPAAEKVQVHDCPATSPDRLKVARADEMAPAERLPSSEAASHYDQMALDPPLDVKVEESACQPSASAAEEQSLRQPCGDGDTLDAQAVRLEDPSAEDASLAGHARTDTAPGAGAAWLERQLAKSPRLAVVASERRAASARVTSDVAAHVEDAPHGDASTRTLPPVRSPERIKIAPARTAGAIFNTADAAEALPEADEGARVAALPEPDDGVHREAMPSAAEHAELDLWI